jgi:hypothetical protein
MLKAPDNNRVALLWQEKGGMNPPFAVAASSQRIIGRPR